MADFEIAYPWIMANEDGPAPYRYKTVPDLPKGAFAISGINSAAYPEQFAEIEAIAQAQRGQVVKNFYLTEFWNSWYSKLFSGELAKRVLDCAINEGPGTAVKILQRAVNSLGGSQIQVDGGWGPVTLQAVNQTQEVQIVAAFKAQRVQAYRDIVNAEIAKGSPVPDSIVAGWLARAEK